MNAKIKYGVWISTVALACGLVACGEDIVDGDGSAGSLNGSGGSGDGDGNGDDTGPGGGENNGSGGTGGFEPQDVNLTGLCDASTPFSTFTSKDSSEEYAREFISISGDSCGFISPRNQVFPICEVDAGGKKLAELANGNEFVLGCKSAENGASFSVSGKVEAGGFTLSSETLTGAGRWAASGNGTLRCTGSKAIDQVQQISCHQVDSEGDALAKTATCDFKPSSGFHADVNCIQLPAAFDTVKAGESDELSFSSCQVAQDGCAFQAVCEDGAFSGQVGPRGIFNISLTDEVKNCRTTESDGLDGACEPLTDEDHHFFALAADCGNATYTNMVKAVIGDEPSCVYRQRGCNWEVHCIEDSQGQKIDFTGTLKPGETKANFRVSVPGGPTGDGFSVPCALEVVDGKINGSCAVPISQGATADCKLSEVANPGADTARCEDMKAAEIDFGKFTTHGCGPVSADCSVGFQHGCSFISACDFGLFEGELMSGTVGRKTEGEGSESVERDVLAFNGVGGYQCEVKKVLASEIGTKPVRENGSVNNATRLTADEWFGTCKNPALPHECRGTTSQNNSSPEFQGLRLFFGERACGLDFTGVGGDRAPVKACPADPLP